MIKCENGNSEIKGPGTIILSELCVLLTHVRKVLTDKYESEELADKNIDNAVKMSRMTEKELEEWKIKLLMKLIMRGGFRCLACMN